MQFLSKTLFISMTCLSLGFPEKSDAGAAHIHRKDYLKIVKLDLAHKGSADSLLFENSKLSVALRIDGSRVSKIETRRNIGNLFVKTKYLLKGDHFILVYAYATSNKHSYNKNDCNMQDNNLDLLGSLGSQLKTKQDLNFSASCNSFPDLKMQISSKVAEISNQSIQDAMVSCIFPYDTEAAIRWKTLPKSDVQFGCVDDSTKYNGVFDSKLNEIRISNICLSKNTFPKVLNEEILHSFGIRDEALAKCLAQCPDKNTVQSCQKFKTPSADYGRDSFFTRQASEGLDGSISPTVADDYNSGKTIEVPKEIAVAQVPQPTVADLKMSHSVESYTVEDSPSGHGSSASSYPNSMMQFASAAVLPEKAYAASSGSSDSSSHAARLAASSSSTSSSPSSSSLARRESFSRLPASDSSLTNPNYSNVADPASVGGPTGKSAAGALKAQSRNRGPTGSDGASTSGNSASSGASLGSAGSSTASARSARAPSSVSNSSDLTRYFQTAPYGEIKQRLKDPQFIQDLKKNSTTVFDTQGHRFGAPQGQIIFSDKGNRFVKEK